MRVQLRHVTPTTRRVPCKKLTDSKKLPQWHRPGLRARFPPFLPLRLVGGMELEGGGEATGQCEEGRPGVGGLAASLLPAPARRQYGTKVAINTQQVSLLPPASPFLLPSPLVRSFLPHLVPPCDPKNLVENYPPFLFPFSPSSCLDPLRVPRSRPSFSPNFPV